MAMTEDATSTLGILESAMRIEQEGRQFYLKAARTTEDKKGQETFATLANDEQKHYDLIKRQHTALTSEGKWVGSPNIKPVDIDLGKPLFPRSIEALKKTFTATSSDWDALLFGLDIEIKSYDLYRKAASQIDDPVGKQMFEFLAEQERSHFDVLMMRYDALFGPIAWQA
jgi:rubrerythrin